MRTIDEIQERIDSGKARIYTAAEFKELVRSGLRPELDDVDAVTCGTMGVMSGTMAILSIPVAAPGSFRRADSITLNGVPGNVGPCPNESLGLVDCIVNGTAHRDGSYGGGHLFRDMVAGKPIQVKVNSEGEVFETSVTLSEIPFARMILTRGCFRNYTCFVNGSSEPYPTIFSGPEPLGPGLTEASVSGCGELNPVQNDPGLRFLGLGASVLLNGAPGMVIGEGTRSSPGKPNLSIAADMHSMSPNLMGGFRTSAGPECVTSVGVVIPVTDEDVLDQVSITDSGVPLPLADASNRIPVEESAYSDVWNGNNDRIDSDHTKCLHCDICEADASCPVGAHPSEGIYPSLCVQCGICVRSCIGNVFSSDMGSITFNGRTVPIAVRQSSRYKADAICRMLKDMATDGRWKLRCYHG